MFLESLAASLGPDEARLRRRMRSPRQWKSCHRAYMARLPSTNVDCICGVSTHVLCMQIVRVLHRLSRHMKRH